MSKRTRSTSIEQHPLRVITDHNEDVRIQPGQISTCPRTAIKLPNDSFVQLNKNNELMVFLPAGEFSQQFIEVVMEELGEVFGDDVIEYARVGSAISMLREVNL